MVRQVAMIFGFSQAAVVRLSRLDGSLMLEVFNQVREAVLNGLGQAIHLPEDPMRDQDLVHAV